MFGLGIPLYTFQRGNDCCHNPVWNHQISDMNTLRELRWAAAMLAASLAPMMAGAQDTPSANTADVGRGAILVTDYLPAGFVSDGSVSHDQFRSA